MNHQLLLLLSIFLPMLLEARRSRRHERELRAHGAIEPAGDVYAVMQVVYPLCFLAMVAEGWWRGGVSGRWVTLGAGVFVAGKALKYWAVATLGSRWTFRVLVIPGAPRITHGPYRWLRHPNYAGVVGELAGVALAAPAPITGVLSLAAFGTLLRARTRVENQALASACGGASANWTQGSAPRAVGDRNAG